MKNILFLFFFIGALAISCKSDKVEDQSNGTTVTKEINDNKPEINQRIEPVRVGDEKDYDGIRFADIMALAEMDNTEVLAFIQSKDDNWIPVENAGNKLWQNPELTQAISKTSIQGLYFIDQSDYHMVLFDDLEKTAKFDYADDATGNKYFTQGDYMIMWRLVDDTKGKGSSVVINRKRATE